MLPTLRPGDRVLVTRGLRALRPGDLVALRDPRCPSRILVKRVAAVASGRVSVAGDNVEASTDSRTFGAVDAGRLLGRVRYRYAPPERAGRIGR
jgi:nickel-type superoxide dismutase maturation protease